MGEKVPENMTVTKTLMSLPEGFKYFVSAWESTSVESQTLQEFTSRLLMKEERLKSSETATALK